MSITVGAALKKVATAILSDPKVLKKLLFALLVLVVAMILPTVMVVSLFSGKFTVDTNKLEQYVVAHMTTADIQRLQNMKIISVRIIWASESPIVLG